MRLRRLLVGVGLALALVPAAAFAEDGNQAAIDAARAEKQMLLNLPLYEHQVLLGQREIANARAIARLLSRDTHAQMEIPNSMEQYRALCGLAIEHLQAGVTNANAMVAARPWDQHAQAELANSTAVLRGVWEMIGDSYPGNPYYTEVRSPSQGGLYSDDTPQLLAEDDELVAEDDQPLLMASVDDADLVVAATVDAIDQ